MARTNKAVGEKIASFRQTRGLTTKELAERSKIKLGLLEDIEKGEYIPGLSPLLKIAKALGTRMGTFVDDQGAGELGPVLSRRGEVPKAIRFADDYHEKNSTLDYYTLAPNKAGRHMEPFIIDIKKSEKDFKPAKTSHEGEEFIYVMDGEIEVIYGKEKYQVKTGDSIYYDSIVDHVVHAPKGNARILAVVYVAG